MYLDANNLYCYAIHTFFRKSGFKLIDSKEFDSSKYTSNSFRGCALKADSE